MLKITVVTPAFNRPNYLEDNINSFLVQNYPNKELMIVDDGSTKDIKKVIPTRESIKYIRIKNSGCPTALNVGIQSTTSDLICVLGDDDMLEGTLSLTKRVEAFDSETEVIYSAANVVDANNRIMSVTNADEFDKRRILKQDYVNIHSMMWRREIHDKIGYFEEDMLSNEDWEFKIKCFMECRVKVLDFITVRYRRHGDMKSMKSHASGLMGECAKKMFERLEKRYENNFDYFTLQ